MRVRPKHATSFAALLLLWGCSGSPAGDGAVHGKSSALNPVSATPAQLSGVLHFHGNFVPDQVQVDARDITGAYTATTRPFGATQSNNAQCMTGSADWCYTIQVESALAHSYVLRPVAYINKQNPYQVARAPFPPSAQVDLGAAGAPVVAPDIDYTPAVVTGTFSATDLNLQPLPIKSDYMSFNDLSNTYPEACGGSADFCEYNSVSDSALATYSAYLQPGSNYTFLSQRVSIDEGPLAVTDFSFDYGLHLGSLGAGQVQVADRAFAQVAQVTGTAQLPVPIYNLEMEVLGTTTTVDPVTLAQLTFDSDYRTLNYYSGLPLASATYTGRVFADTDFTKPISLRPSLTLSADRGTLLGFPPAPLDFSQSKQIVQNFTGQYATITSRVTLVPPYPIKNGVYPAVQAAESEVNGSYGSAQTTYNTDANGGTFVMPAYGTPTFSGNWNLWRFGWNLDLGDPNFTATYLVGQYLTIPVQVASGGNVTPPDFTFPTALVKVFFSAPTSPPGTTITDPKLTANSDDGDSANAEGLNQNSVITGQANMVLRAHIGPNGPVAFHITPSAVINAGGPAGTSRTDFGPITLFPHGGDVTVIGVPGSIALTITAPQEGQVFQVCQIPVTGLSTGQPGIGITVNGQSVAAPSTNNPGDPLQVGFTTTLTPPPGPVTVSVTASDGNGHMVTDTRHVSCLQALNHPPTIVCPGPGSTPCVAKAGTAASVQVAINDPDGDALSMTWTVDGNLVQSDTAAAAALTDNYTGNLGPYGHTVVVTASDGKGGSATCTTTMNIASPIVNTSVQTPQLSTPNHTMVNVGWQFAINDHCANIATRVVKVYSNEADVVNGNDGLYSPDARTSNIPNTQVTIAVKLRAERAIPSAGRIYLIVHRVVDTNGHPGWSCTSVTVPLDLTPANVQAINSLAAQAVTSCNATGTPPGGYVQVGPGPLLGPFQ